MRGFILMVGLLGSLALPTRAAAEWYSLEFIPTQNARPGVQGTMSIKVANGETIVHFRLRGGYPNTVYTIWTVFNILVWPLPSTGTPVPSISATTRPWFPPEGNAVAPLAPLTSGFTSGMGFDPGATFVSDANGDGEVQVRVDYNLVGDARDGPPVGNKDIIVQCAPSFSNCTKQVLVTTTWLRKFIGAYALADRASLCANYDPRYDPDVKNHTTGPVAGIDARLWQCVDPATVNPATGEGLPRVQRYPFDHFRLAPHPDDLTHGLLGGNPTDHYIDMVGRRSDLSRQPGMPRKLSD